MPSFVSPGFFTVTPPKKKNAHMGNVEMVVITGADLRLAEKSAFPHKNWDEIIAKIKFFLTSYNAYWFVTLITCFPGLGIDKCLPFLLFFFILVETISVVKAETLGNSLWKCLIKQTKSRQSSTESNSVRNNTGTHKGRQDKAHWKEHVCPQEAEGWLQPEQTSDSKPVRHVAFALAGD